MTDFVTNQLQQCYIAGAAGAGAYCCFTSFSFSLYSTLRTSFIWRSLLICRRVRRVFLVSPSVG